MKPLVLLARCSRPWQAAAPVGWSSAASDVWMATATLAAPQPQQVRAFSSNQGGGGGGGGGDNDRLTSFPIRRPQQVRNNQQQQQQGRPNNYNMKSQGAGGEPLLRTHMIDLFPGNYDDDDEGGAGMETDDWGDDDENYSEMEEAMAELHRQSIADEAQKQRWLENSIPPVRVPVIDSMGRSYGRGGRKAAQARVWLTPGFGNVTVNRKDFIDYFPRRSDREAILEPLVVTRTCGKFDLQCIVKGGGLTGQSGAIRLGVARALQYWNPEYRPPLKKMGYLTRDARKVERKKIGRVKARKRPQWNRR